MPHLKSFIAENPSDWLPKLVETYKIDAVTAGDLVSLKYDQINSPMAEPIVQECRGMVVHVPTGQVLAHPYNKFWNHGEHLAAPIDWSTARVQDKLDGSLMTLHWNPFESRWSVASSGHPVAGGSYGKTAKTFGEVFWDVFYWDGFPTKALPSRTDVCFMFELIAPDNRIVCRYDKPRVVLHGARHLETEEELPRAWLANFAENHNWEIVTELPVTNIDDCLAAAAVLDPAQHEGFVVVDNNFNRVKIKSLRYVALHHLKGNGAVNRRRAIDLWKAGEVGELLTHFPEMASDVQPVLDALTSAAQRAFQLWYAANALSPTRKDFALMVKDSPVASVCFKLYSSDDLPSVDAALSILRGLSTATLENILEKLRLVV